MASSSRSSSILHIRGSSAASSIPSSSRDPRVRTRFSPGSSPPPPGRSASGARRLGRSRRPVTDAPVFRDDALFVIAGPCVLEDDALNLRVADHLAKLAERIPGGIVFKASFDKANRSNRGAHRSEEHTSELQSLAYLV